MDSGPAPEPQTEERVEKRNLLPYFLIPFLFLLLCLFLLLFLFMRPKKKDEKEEAVPPTASVPPQSAKTSQKLPKN